MTIINTPSNYQSVNEILVWTVYDANSIDPTKLDYKYIAECWVNGTLVQTQRVYPMPNNNYGVFDFTNIIRQYITPELINELGLSKFNTTAILNIREEYNGAVSGVVATTDERTFFNHYSGLYYDLNGLRSIIYKLYKPLTNRPKNIYIAENDIHFYLPVFTPNVGDQVQLSIDGGTYTTIATSTLKNSCQQIDLVGMGITNNIIIKVGSEEKEFDIKMVCSNIYNTYTLTFLNKYGAFESFTFTKVSKKNINIEQKTYNKKGYKIDNNGLMAVNENNITLASKTVFGKTFTEKLRITSDLLTNDEWVWLAELVCSPIVYIMENNIDNSILVPIIINNSNYDFNKIIVDGLKPLILDIEFNRLHKTQFV